MIYMVQKVTVRRGKKDRVLNGFKLECCIEFIHMRGIWREIHVESIWIPRSNSHTYYGVVDNKIDIEMEFTSIIVSNSIHPCLNWTKGGQLEIICNVLFI